MDQAMTSLRHEAEALYERLTKRPSGWHEALQVSADEARDLLEAFAKAQTEALRTELAAVREERDALVLSHERDMAALQQERDEWKDHHANVVRSKREGSQRMKAHYEQQLADLQAERDKLVKLCDTLREER